MNMEEFREFVREHRRRTFDDKRDPAKNDQGKCIDVERNQSNECVYRDDKGRASTKI